MNILSAAGITAGILLVAFVLSVGFFMGIIAREATHTIKKVMKS